MRRRHLLKNLSFAATGGLLPLSTTAQTPKAKRVMRIAHLTDVHIQPLIGAAKGFERCLHHLQNLDVQPDLIINSGDSVMEAHSRSFDNAKRQWRLFNDVLRSENSLPVVHCIGNHDIWCKQENLEGFSDGKKWAMDELQMTQRYFSFEYKGWHIIMLDSVQPKPDGTWYTAHLDAAQLAWLKQTLSGIPSHLPILVVSHVPILSACVFLDGKNLHDGQWRVPGSWMHTDAKSLVELFYQHPNVKLALSGHIHLLDSVNYNGINYCCNGAVSGAWWFGKYQQTEAGYAIVDLYEDGSFTNQYSSYKLS